MDIVFLVEIFLSAFLGFAVGRYGDKWGGNIYGPHHWIYGLVVIGFGFWWGGELGLLTIASGVTLFISDLNDFLKMRFIGRDEPHEWRFWSIL
jgi:hypothetical protein